MTVAEYERCWLLNLYVPMASWHGPGRARRDVWDQRMARVVQVGGGLRDGSRMGLHCLFQPTEKPAHPKLWWLLGDWQGNMWPSGHIDTPCWDVFIFQCRLHFVDALVDRGPVPVCTVHTEPVLHGKPWFKKKLIPN